MNFIMANSQNGYKHRTDTYDIETSKCKLEQDESQQSITFKILDNLSQIYIYAADTAFVPGFTVYFARYILFFLTVLLFSTISIVYLAILRCPAMFLSSSPPPSCWIAVWTPHLFLTSCPFRQSIGKTLAFIYLFLINLFLCLYAFIYLVYFTDVLVIVSLFLK